MPLLPAVSLQSLSETKNHRYFQMILRINFWLIMMKIWPYTGTYVSCFLSLVDMKEVMRFCVLVGSIVTDTGLFFRPLCWCLVRGRRIGGQYQTTEVVNGIVPNKVCEKNSIDRKHKKMKFVIFIDSFTFVHRSDANIDFLQRQKNALSITDCS